jgi:hypothetical protein
LFVAGTGTPSSVAVEDAIASVSFLGVNPVSVDEAGATYYAYSEVLSVFGDDSGETNTGEFVYVFNIQLAAWLIHLVVQ